MARGSTPWYLLTPAAAVVVLVLIAGAVGFTSGAIAFVAAGRPALLPVDAPMETIAPLVVAIFLAVGLIDVAYGRWVVR